jgi:phage-related tail protein
MNGESARLRLELNATRASSERGRARVDALRQEANDLQAQLDRAGAASSATEAEIQALTQEVERKQQAIRELLQESEVE